MSVTIQSVHALKISYSNNVFSEINYGPGVGPNEEGSFLISVTIPFFCIRQKY